VSVKRTNLSHSRQLFRTPDSCLTHLFPRSQAVVAYTVIHLVTPDCTRGVIDPLYHSRYNDRDRQYKCDRGIKMEIPGADISACTSIDSIA